MASWLSLQTVSFFMTLYRPWIVFWLLYQKSVDQSFISAGHLLTVPVVLSDATDALLIEQPENDPRPIEGHEERYSLKRAMKS